MLFSKKDLRALLIPLVIEQVLTGIMGIADTLMVSTVGEAALSGVSLVDSINQLAVYFFSSLAAGGTVVCAQYIGHGEPEKSRRAAGQVMLLCGTLSVSLCVLLLPLRLPLLKLIFGRVETAVMESADIYFFITLLSYPALALYTACAALFRATGETRRPMYVAATADLLNVGGNALLIYVFDMGAAGAALSTLLCRIFSAAALLLLLRKPGQMLSPEYTFSLRPDRAMLRRILRIGLPNAVENGMFQFGKLAVQSTVSFLGTTAIAAQAMVVTFELFGSMPGMAIGTGLLTVAGQCMGRGDIDGTKYYIRRFTRISFLTCLGTGILLSAVIPFAVQLTGLSPEGAAITCRLIWFTCALKLLFWPPAFTLPNGLRAAGDVSFAMWVTTLSMWVLRVGMSWVLCRYTGVGLWGVWIGWCTDWMFRCICFSLRYRSNRWTNKTVLR